MTKNTNHHDLDSIFEALASKHRREIVYALGLQPHSVSQLAQMRDLSLPAIHKHIKLLEAASLVLSKKTGRTNFLTLNKQTLLKLQDWLMQYHAYWGSNDATLENYTQYLSKKTKGGEKKQ
ncbi:MAG: winged helix-turn-helix domain-containing protein [Patescibacteria group bacterium]